MNKDLFQFGAYCIPAWLVALIAGIAVGIAMLAAQ